MKGLLDNIRSRTRSPPLSRGRRPTLSSNRRHQGMASGRDEELEAAMAASLVDRSNYPVPFAAPRPVGGPYLGDDEAAVAAAIGASLDMLDNQDDHATKKPSKPHTANKGKGAGNLGGGDGGGDGVGATVGGGGGGGGGGDASTPPPRPGSNASQDLAFLTDAPLLPPAGGARRGEPTDTDAAGRGRNAEGQGGREIAGGAMVFGEGGPVTVLVPASRRRGRGTEPGMAPGTHRRARTEEDEALARRLQAQWISEDSAGGDEGGDNDMGGVQWPGTRNTHAHPSVPGLRHCAGCGLPIWDASFRHGAAGSYHMGCPPTPEPRLPPCMVCHEALPAEDGRIHFYRHNFFHDVYCPWHHDSSPRCFSCMRLEPNPRADGGGEGPFAELQDGRMVCMPCAQTAVVDSSEGAPAYQDVCRFFEQELSLPVPREMRGVPILLVDSPSLNEQTHRDPSHGAGAEQGMPTTRGLTLSEVATVKHMASGAMHFNASAGRFEVGPPTQVYLGERRAVTAILVLCGLPFASFSSILAHEAMHAWIKLEPSFPSRLPSQVEEGVCQLIALLWLEHLLGTGTGDEGGGRGRSPGSPPSNEDLRGFFAHQIKTDVSEVYGDGFRKAKAAYDAVGLETLLGHIKLYKAFPNV